MKHFRVILSDKQPKLMTEELIRAHVEYLDQLYQKDLVMACGPCTDQTALMIIKANSQEEAEKMIAGDPFSKVRYYRAIDISEFLLANPDNNFHLDTVLNKLRSN